MRNSISVFILLVSALAADAGDWQDYPAEIKPIIERRCMVCHGCYDAPCQLKLDAYPGLTRGAHKEKVYNGTRLRTAQLTRLLEDASSTQEWRGKGFYPVLNQEDYRKSQLFQLLQQKQNRPLPARGRLPRGFDFSLNRKQQCPKPGEMGRYRKNYPLWGMPYGLPGLSDSEHTQLVNWLAEGAPGETRPKPAPAVLNTIAAWEEFLNGSSLKQQLMARYIYEHLYVGNLHFPDIDHDGFFKLVRSRTPPGQAIDLIATRRPYDSPGKAPFFYRLQSLETSVLVKRHMPYALSQQRMHRWRTLFLEPEYAVIRLPGYSTALASNPFKTFRDLPVKSRYRFMLDEAQFTIMGFIKGPVCRGQIALNVIEDHFWATFVDPDSYDPELDAEFLNQQSDNLKIPSGNSGPLITLVEWRRYASAQRRYLEAKSTYLDQRTRDESMSIDMNIIWDGDGSNDNASLTVFRHFDSASVHKGMLGQTPKTAWLISYPILERIHYLLVAGFDVYGNVGHQLETRLYMDFLRMESEYNFLVLLPEKDRLRLRDYWYRDAGNHIKEYVLGRRAWFNRETDIVFRQGDAKAELLSRLRQQLPGANNPRYQVDDTRLLTLQGMTGEAMSHMPDTAFLDVLNARGEDQVYTLIRNSGHSNVAHIFAEQKRRLPKEDTMTVTPGLVGYYPNTFFQVNENELATFVARIGKLSSEEDYRALIDIYGVRRNASYFWPLSDKLHDVLSRQQPLEAGLFDYNRYENR